MKVEDIKPAGLRAGQRAAMAEDIAWLADRQHRFAPVPCPACTADAPRFLYEKNAVTHVLCAECKTQYVTPRPTAETLGEFYAQSANYAYWSTHIFPASEAARRTKIFLPRAMRTAQLAEKNNVTGGVLVEVGCAHGLFCEAVTTLGVFARVIGIEPTPELAESSRRRGIEVIEAPYERTALDTRADIIAAFEVIEHLHDPADFLRWCRSSLRPAGSVLLTCPNSRGFDTLSLGRDADAVDHEHINLFHPTSIKLLMERLGFANIVVTTPGELDFDIMKGALADGRISPAALGPFLTELLARDDPAIARCFQTFLQETNLSSNMMITAQQPAA